VQGSCSLMNESTGWAAITRFPVRENRAVKTYAGGFQQRATAALPQLQAGQGPKPCAPDCKGCCGAGCGLLLGHQLGAKEA
jgi:hypothetical protein